MHNNSVRTGALLAIPCRTFRLYITETGLRKSDNYKLNEIYKKNLEKTAENVFRRNFGEKIS